MILVGPYNDNGWSQANYEGGLYVEERLPEPRWSTSTRLTRLIDQALQSNNWPRNCSPKVLKS